MPFRKLTKCMNSDKRFADILRELNEEGLQRVITIS